jgi:hypothetical protein
MSLLDDIVKENTQTKFYYLVIVIIVFFFVSQILNIQLYHFMGILLISIIIYNLNSLKNENVTNDMEIIDYYLASLQLKMYDYIDNYLLKLNPNINATDLENIRSRSKLDYLYLDANMITLLYSLIDFYDYSPSNFQMLLKCINNLLHIRNDLEFLGPIDRPADHFEIAQSLVQKAMNYLETFQIVIPKNSVTNKLLTDALSRMNILLKRNLDIIVQICNKDAKENLSANTRFISYYNGVKPFYQDINISLTPEHNKMRSLQQNPLFEYYY